MEEKVAQLEKILRENAPLIVAYSGGVDSACLLAMATRTLGDQVLGVIADSPSLPRKALEEALTTAKEFGAQVETIPTFEMENPDYTVNPPNRCYFCKSELFLRLDRLAEERGFAAIAYGENADDPAHLRPGSKAAAEFKILGPLKQAGLTKADVRELSRKLGLPTADAPAQPCLSSRIPHGTPVTREALDLVERGEEFIRSMGFRIFRVRYIAGDSPQARVQIAPAEMTEMAALRPKIESGLLAAGFSSVEIDPEGYRSAGG
ncbi:MAG: ATP-dependent sacrificial sulfur transferase LarE [Chthoniobacterales bacterium]